MWGPEEVKKKKIMQKGNVIKHSENATMISDALYATLKSMYAGLGHI